MSDQSPLFAMLAIVMRMDCPLTPTERWVAVAIASHMNSSTGEAWPSLRLLRQKTGLGHSTVCAAIGNLEKGGILVRTKGGARPGARYESTCYRLAAAGEQSATKTANDPEQCTSGTPSEQSTSWSCPAPGPEQSTTWTGAVQVPDTELSIELQRELEQRNCSAVAEPAPPPPALVLTMTPSGTKRGATKTTWLSPYVAAWKQRWGQESEPVVDRLLRPLRRAEENVGATEAQARWVRYLASQSDPQWCSGAAFLAGLGTWADHPTIAAAQQRPGQGRRLSVGDQNMANAAAAIEQHRRRTAAAPAPPLQEGFR